MITLKELNYVSDRASKTPYPGLDYATAAAEKLINSVEMYEKYYKGKEFDLILSNGEQFEFEIYPMNLCHMLGIDFKNLSDSYFEYFRRNILGINGLPRSYDLLTAIVENIEEVLKFDKEDCRNAGKILNYYRMMVKCSIFEKLSDFSKFNFGVIDFVKDVYNKVSGSTFRGNAEKLLYVQSNEQVCPYFMMGVLPDGFGKKNETEEVVENPTTKYAVETLFAPTNVKNFFLEQKVSIPTQILITTADEMIKKEASPANKIALLNQYKTIVKEYDITNNMDIYSDYMAMLSASENAQILNTGRLTLTKTKQ